MAHFLFRFHRGGRAPVVRQLLAPDLDAAIRQGNHSVIGYLSDPRHAGDGPAGRLDIEDERARVVARLLFSEVARRIGMPRR